MCLSKLVKIETSSRYLTVYWDKAKRPLVLIISKMSGYVKKFIVKDGRKDKNKKIAVFSYRWWEGIWNIKSFGPRLKIWKI